VDATHKKLTTFTYEVPSITPGNGFGLLHSVTDADNHVATFGYDLAGHKVTYPNGTETEAWGYDNAYNPTWRRTVNGTTQRFYQYDNRNRNLHMTWTNDSSRPEFTADSSTFVYDPVSRLTDANNGNFSGLSRARFFR